VTIGIASMRQDEAVGEGEEKGRREGREVNLPCLRWSSSYIPDYDVKLKI